MKPPRTYTISIGGKLLVGSLLAIAAGVAAASAQPGIALALGILAFGCVAIGS